MVNSRVEPGITGPVYQGIAADLTTERRGLSDGGALSDTKVLERKALHRWRWDGRMGEDVISPVVCNPERSRNEIRVLPKKQRHCTE